MKKKPTLTQESFDRLLDWLHPDREVAGIKYEEIRVRLIKILARRGCNCAEEIADETINRVITRIGDIRNTYVGDPSLYFYGVANNLFLEYLKRRPQPLPASYAQPSKERNDDYECLDICIEQLPAESRWLIVEYYQQDKQAKIDYRRELAETMGITPHTLRMRAHRIKAILKKCIIDCRRRAKKT